MSYHVLRLRTLMNRPERVDLAQAVIALDEEDPPAAMLLGDALVKAALKSPAVEPYDLVGYWKLSARMAEVPLPAIENFFQKTPILLHGHAHREARQALLPVYRRLETALDRWLTAFSRAFFLAREGPQPVPALLLATVFVDELNRSLLAQDLGCPPESLPPLPNKLFNLLQRAQGLQAYDARLNHLVQDMAHRLQAQHRNPDEAWALVSVAVMGQEALLAALVYSLVHPTPAGRWEADALMRAAAPVSMLVGRRVLADVTLEGHGLRKGQTVYICPFLSHRALDVPTAPGKSAASYSFGMGPHLCAGRSIALKLTQAFLDARHACPGLAIDGTGLRFSRDINLLVEQTYA